jgi:hypothetical protein
MEMRIAFLLGAFVGMPVGAGCVWLGRLLGPTLFGL